MTNKHVPARPLEYHGKTPLEARGSAKAQLSNRVAGAWQQMRERVSGMRGAVGERLKAEADTRTPTYNVLGEAVPANPAAAQLAGLSRELVKNGFLSARDAEGLEFRVVNTKDVGAAEKLADQLYGFGSKLSGGADNNRESHFEGRQGLITVNARGMEDLELPGHLKQQFSYLHELGHGTKDAASVRQLVSQSVEGISTNMDDYLSNKELLGESQGVLDTSARLDAQRWSNLAEEMYADTFAIAATANVAGKDAALRMADSVSLLRDRDNRDNLNFWRGHTGPDFHDSKTLDADYLEAHHTSAAIAAVKEKIRCGALDDVSSIERDHILGECVAKGIVQEYTQIRMAELNVHHIGKEQKLVPSLPEGVSEKDFLVNEMMKPARAQTDGITILAPDNVLRDTAQPSIANAALSANWQTLYNAREGQEVAYSVTTLPAGEHTLALKEGTPTIQQQESASLERLADTAEREVNRQETLRQTTKELDWGMRQPSFERERVAERQR